MEDQNSQPPIVGQSNPTDISDVSRANRSPATNPPNSPTNDANDTNDGDFQDDDERTEEPPDPGGPSEPDEEASDDKEVVYSAILRNVNSTTTGEDEWLFTMIEKIRKRFNKLPNGWWKKVTEEYNKKFNLMKTVTQVKNQYGRVRKDVEKTTDNRNRESTREPTVPMTITNTALYTRIRNMLTINVEKALTQETERKRTRKLYSRETDDEVIQMMNQIIQMDSLESKANNIKEMNDILYACQLTYDEVTEKPRHKSVWKQSIEKIIEDKQQQLEIVTSHQPNETPSNELKQLCKVKQIHSNNSDQLEKLKDQLEESISVYQKKIVISENRIEFRRANRKYELFRGLFYRDLDDEKKEISDDIDMEEVTKFWTEMWSDDQVEMDHQDLTDRLEPVELQVDTSEEQLKETIEKKIMWLPNWKSPGPDQVYNFFIKRMYSLHGRLIQLILEVIDNPELIDESLYTGTTILIPKVELATRAEETRPITCLPNIYKLVSKVATGIITNICEVNEVVSEEQMGTRRGCQGAKQQALTNKAFNEKYDNLLYTSWIDVKKAYDSVRHDYLMAVISKLSLPPNMIQFVQRMLTLQRTRLICNKQEIGRVRISKGLLQGDSLSPLLFVIAMEPLSRKLESCEKLHMGGIERNHLIFIDDIKLLSETEDHLKVMCQITEETLKKMGLSINQQKSASNIDDEEVFGEKIDDIKGYKYLGILEDSHNVVKEENKVIVIKKITERTRKLCQTKLNAVNLFRAINEYALSTLNYYIGLLPFEPKEYDEIDKKIRRILSEYKITRNAANMDRLYLKRCKLGRGLSCAVEKAEIMLLKLHEALNSNPKTQALIDQEKEEFSRLGLIREHLTEKYQLTDSDLNEKNIREKQENARMERIMSKNMHSILYTNDDIAQEYDMRSSAMWLTKGNISPQQEGFLTKLQDRNLYFGDTSVKRKCPHCRTGTKSVEHLATFCGGMLELYYKKRHDEVVRCLHFLFVKKYGLSKNKRLKNYKVEKVISNERVKIKSDVKIDTEIRLEYNKPDLMIHDLRTKEITLIEVGITNKKSLATNELKKSQKYDLLASELRCLYPGSTVTTIPVVMTWDGLVTRHFKRYMKQLGVKEKLMAYMQFSVLKRTCESILVDVRNGLRSDWLESEVDEMMNQLENNPAGSSQEQ